MNLRGAIATLTVALAAVLITANVSFAKSKHHISRNTYSTSTQCLPPQVKKALSGVSKYGKVTIISSYRKNAVIAGTRKRSKHASCKAVDFNISGNKSGAIKWLRSQRLEVITYGCAMHHIHIATGNYKGYKCVNSRGIAKRRK